jgi:hypothetical protein
MVNAVHFTGVRCDGQAHGGCQAGCLIYWKEAWLKWVDEDGQEATGEEAVQPRAAPSSGWWRRPARMKSVIRARPRAPARGPQPAPPWDVRQYVLDVTSGNIGVLATIRGVIVGVLNEHQEFSRRFVPRWLRIHGGKRFPFIDGSMQNTPSKP